LIINIKPALEQELLNIRTQTGGVLCFYKNVFYFFSKTPRSCRWVGYRSAPTAKHVPEAPRKLAGEAKRVGAGERPMMTSSAYQSASYAFPAKIFPSLSIVAGKVRIRVNVGA
jgi:hypothetical protein